MARMGDSAFRPMSRFLLLAPAFAALTLQGAAQERQRADIPEQHTWNLADVYPSVDAWRAAKDRMAAEIPAVGKFAGTLGSSPAALANALDKMYAVDKDLSRLYVYASMLADQDTRDSAHEGMRQQMTQLAATFSAQAAYVEPEILRFPDGTVARFGDTHYFITTTTANANHGLTISRPGRAIVKIMPRSNVMPSARHNSQSVEIETNLAVADAITAPSSP